MTAPTTPRARLFLSYGRRDASDLANRLRVDLETRGFEVWQDTQRIRSGADWQQQIEQALRECQVLVALLTPHSTRVTGAQGNVDDLDSVCLDEISVARFGRPPKPVVPVMAITCEPPLSIYRLNHIDMRDVLADEARYLSALDQLVTAVGEAIRGKVQYRSWENQLRPWDFSAFLNDKRQHFFGREWLFDEIERWRTADQTKALVVVGDPGTGKSAVVAELVHRNPGGQVLAYHCCQADTRETLQPARFVRNLAAMIASKVPEYAERLSEPVVEEALSEAGCARDPASAFEAGILTPLRSLAAPEGGARYLLVDALDESLALVESGQHGRTTILDVLATRLDRLPEWLKLMATSRNDATVLDRLRGARRLQLDAHDPRNLDDIGRYIAGRLASPVLQERLRQSGLTADQATAVLREKADGNILYVIRALEGIERDLYGFNHLDELPPGLYGLYLGYFNRAFPDEASYAPARGVLEVIVASRAPMREERLALTTGLDRETELPRVLRRLSAYLHEQNGRYTVYHKSFADWLTAADNRGTLHYVSATKGHERLANLFWKEYERGPETLSNYGRTNLAAHLAGAGRWEQLEKLLCDLRYVEAKCKSGMASRLIADYDLALNAWPDHKRYDPFARPKPEAVAAWLGESVAGVLAGNADVHADRGASPVLAGLRTLSDEQRDPGPQTPHHAAGERLPDAQFSADQGARAALDAMRRAETPAGPSNSSFDTPVRRVQAFATFVTTHFHVLTAMPELTLRTARNHAAEGVVAQAAESRLASDREPRLVRDPRPAPLPEQPVCLRTLEGHEHRVNCVVLAPDGRVALSSGSDTQIRVWNLDTGLCTRVLTGHDRSVRAVAVSANLDTAVSASHDTNLRVWALASGSTRRVLRGHTNWANAVALTPDGKLAVSASNDQKVRVWDVASGKCLHTLSGHTDEVRSVAVSADGKVAVSGGHDAIARIWDVAAGKCLRLLRGHTDFINGVALTADGRTAFTVGRDRTVRVWDVASGACLRSMEGSDNWVNAVSITPDGRLAVTVGFDLAVRVWDVRTGECVRRLFGHTAWVSDVAVTADGRLAATAGSDHTVRVWDLADGRCAPTLAGHSNWVCPVALSPDEKLAVSPSRDRQARIWDAATGKCLHVLEGHANWVNFAEFAPDGKSVITAAADNTLRIWDVASGKCLHVLEGHINWANQVAITPDGTLAVSPGSDNTVRIWDVARGKLLHTLEGHTDWPTYVTLSPDGGAALTSGRDGTVRVWDLVGDHGERQSVLDPPHRLVTATCQRVLEKHDDYIEGHVVTPDGRLCVSGGNDRTARVWDLATGACRHVLAGHTGFVESVGMTPDGRFVLTPSRDFTVKVWDLASGSCVRALLGHRYGVTGAVVTPDGLLAVTSSWDNTLRVWHLPTGACLAVYHAGARVAYATVGAGGRIVCGTSDGQVHFLTLHNYTPGPPLLTAVRLRRHTVGEKAPTLPSWLSFVERLLPGQRPFDRELTAVSPYSGRRFAIPATVLDAIRDITRSAGLKPEQPPCVTLPASVWDDPRLTTACPHTGRPLRFNPFVVDNSV
jgi:WD40 repeat protein